MPAKAKKTMADVFAARAVEGVPFDAPRTNRHPADELSDVRAEIARLEKRMETLRAQLLEEGADLEGDFYTAAIIPGVRETLDRKALTEAFGEKAVAPFLKSTNFRTVKLVEKTKNAKA